jgi:hypothetical protein
MPDKSRLSKLIGGLVAGAGLLVGYALAIRPRILTWGATNEEVERRLPGDDLVRDPQMVSTHAVTIERPPSQVWPWVVQIGHQRAGWYSYDWLHRLMGIAGSVEDESRSAEHVLPQLQDLRVGDEVEIAPDVAYNVVAVEPGRGLVLYVAVDTESLEPFDPFDPAVEPLDDYFASSWTWFLDQIGEDKTRLIVRIRIGYSPGLATALMIHGVIEPGSFIMERKTLLGIKRRAEAVSS